MKNPQDNESFASRWSRRKQEMQSEPEEKGALIEEEPQQPSEEDRLAALNTLTDEDMPELETLGENSDYAGFMSINVSEELRKLALRKLFHGKTFNIRDGLDEYDGDYTQFEKLDPSIITADMKHLLEVEAEKLLAKEAQESEGEQITTEQPNLDEVVAAEEAVATELTDQTETEINPDNDNKEVT